MIRISLVHTKYSHWGKYSGFSQLVSFLNPIMFDKNIYEVSDSDDDFPIKKGVIKDWIGSYVKKNGMKWYKLSDLAAEFKLFLSVLKKETDIIHFLDAEHSAQFLPIVLTKFRFNRPKLIATFHQTPDILDELIDTKVIKNFDLITVMSPDQIDYFAKHTEKNKIKFIPHGVNTDFFQPNFSNEMKEVFRCIIVGHWRRDFETIKAVAKALEKNRNIEFVFVTSSRAFPGNSGLEDLKNVKLYRNNITDDELLKLYQSSDVLFLPLFASTANNALLEGISCGLPVISTALPSVQAYLTGNEAILIKKNEKQDFIDSILKLANNHRECKIRSKDARKRSLELDWKIISSEYEKVYSNLMDIHCSSLRTG